MSEDAPVVLDQGQVAWTQGKSHAVDEATPQSRLSPNDGDVFGAEDHRSNCGEPGGELRAGTSIDSQCSIALVPAPLKRAIADIRLNMPSDSGHV